MYSPALLSLLLPALPRLLLACVLVPQTPRASRPWWIAASVACEAARVVVALASDSLTGAAAVLDMVVFAGVYGSWAVIVTCVVGSTRAAAESEQLEGHSVATATGDVAETAGVGEMDKSLNGDGDGQGQPVSTSSSVSTDLGSFGESVAAVDDQEPNEYAQLQDRISTDLESLNLVCTTHQPAPSSSHPSHATPESVPLSPGGWIASAHHLAATPSTLESSTTDVVADGLRRRRLAGDSEQPAPATATATTSASLSRALRSAASSIASFASASNLLYTPDDAAAADGDQAAGGPGPELRVSAADAPGAGPGIVVDACQVPLPASRSQLLLVAMDLHPADDASSALRLGDACHVPLPASRSRLLVADDGADETLAPKPEGTGGSVGECGDAGAAGGSGGLGPKAATTLGRHGAECQGFQL